MQFTMNLINIILLVATLFSPYFILLYLITNLKKKINTLENNVKGVVKDVNQNFLGQNKNWELQLKQDTRLLSRINNLEISSTENNVSLNNLRSLFLEMKKNSFNENKKTLKQILENPIDTTKKSCETKVKIKKEVKPAPNDIQTVTSIKNKFDFECGILEFKKGYTFTKSNDFLTIHRYGKVYYSFPVKDDYTNVLWNEVLRVNAPKPKRKYKKRITINKK